MKISILFLLLFIGNEANAFSWRDLWKTADQQAQELMNKGQYKKAKEQFIQPDWRGAAAYRAGDYQQAASLFESLHSEAGYYNQGNALAHMGRYEQAINAYDEALKLNPENRNAQYNRKLVENLLKKDQQKQKNQDKQENKQNNSQNQNQQNNQQQQNKNNQQNQNQQGNNQQNQQNNKDQEDKSQKTDQKNKADQAKEEKAQQEQQKSESDNKQTQSTENAEKLEKQQAKEQWLRLIPDDPGGLMREKFLRDHLKRQRGWYQ